MPFQECQLVIDLGVFETNVNKYLPIHSDFGFNRKSTYSILIKLCLIVFFHFQLSLIYREREIYKLEEISTQVGPVKEEELENVIQGWKNSKKLARPAETRNGQSRKK